MNNLMGNWMDENIIPKEHVYLYCILVSGYDETNEDVVGSAVDEINNTVDYVLGPSLIEKFGVRKRLMKMHPYSYPHHSLNRLPLKVKYLALFCFLYIIRRDDAAVFNLGGSKTFIGMKIEPEKALGWALCIYKYYNDAYAYSFRLEIFDAVVKQIGYVIAWYKEGTM